MSAIGRLLVLGCFGHAAAARICAVPRVDASAFIRRAGGVLLGSHDLREEHAEVFRGLLPAPSPDTESTGPQVAYVWTAKAAPSTTSTRPPGEQRRRARADARKKAQELSQRLGVAMLLVDVGDAVEKWRELVLAADGVYVAGGNTFWLHHQASRPGGFYDVLQEKQAGASADGFLYCGVSAGGIIAGDTIDPALWKGWDDPRVLGDEVVIDWARERGLGWAGLQAGAVEVFPHYEARWAGLVEKRLAHWAAEGLQKEVLLLRQRGFDGDLAAEAGTSPRGDAEAKEGEEDAGARAGLAGESDEALVDDTEPCEVVHMKFDGADKVAWRPARGETALT